MAHSKEKGLYTGNPTPAQKKLADIDLRFLDQGFYDAGGNLREDLLDTQAKALGERFAPIGEGERVQKGTDQVSTAQIRRFYGDVKALKNEMKNSGIKMESDRQQDLAPFRARIKMLKSKVSYAAGRDKVSNAFRQLIEKCVEAIRCPRDFAGFALFFESLLGYYYYFHRVKKGVKKGGETSDE